MFSLWNFMRRRAGNAGGAIWAHAAVRVRRRRVSLLSVARPA